MKTDTKIYQTKLEAEKAILEKELLTVARQNPNQKGEWQPMSTDMEKNLADENEVADVLEDFEENIAIAGKLEEQLVEVNAALDRIANGTFGTCEVCNKAIDANRLEANPSARTCIEHAKQK